MFDYIVIRDNEGRKINYKLRKDDEGYFVNRFGMRGCLELTYSNDINRTNGKTITQREFKISHYNC